MLTQATHRNLPPCDSCKLGAKKERKKERKDDPQRVTDTMFKFFFQKCSELGCLIVGQMILLKIFFEGMKPETIIEFSALSAN